MAPPLLDVSTKPRSARVRTVVGKNVEETARRVAEEIARLSRDAGPAPVTIALSGGSTPKRLYEILAEPPLADEVRWDRLEIFFGDERAVAPDHADSNWRMASEALLSKVKVVAHRMRAEADAAEEYEALLRDRVPSRRGEIPVLDLVLLGIGKDGHTASLFPGTAALDETARHVVMNDVPQLKTRRMTFTYPLINAARRVWILACGEDKREILKACQATREPDAEKKWPVLGVKPKDGELVWWLDELSSGVI